MKKTVKKNHLLVTALAVMIAAAGYLNFSAKDITMIEDHEKKAQKDSEELSLVSAPTEEVFGEETEHSGNGIGEAVLTSGNVKNYVANAKLNREQAHARAKENLEKIIKNESISEEQKQGALDQLAGLSDRMEKQTTAEELLGGKGFLNSVVMMNDDTVDVMVTNQDLSEVSKAQIEDIVSRTCGCKINEIIISKMKINK